MDKQNNHRRIRGGDSVLDDQIKERESKAERKKIETENINEENKIGERRNRAEISKHQRRYLNNQKANNLKRDKNIGRKVHWKEVEDPSSDHSFVSNNDNSDRTKGSSGYEQPTRQSHDPVMHNTSIKSRIKPMGTFQRDRNQFPGWVEMELLDIDDNSNAAHPFITNDKATQLQPFSAYKERPSTQSSEDSFIIHGVPPLLSSRYLKSGKYRRKTELPQPNLDEKYCAQTKTKQMPINSLSNPVTSLANRTQKVTPQCFSAREKSKQNSVANINNQNGDSENEMIASLNTPSPLRLLKSSSPKSPSLFSKTKISPYSPTSSSSSSASPSNPSLSHSSSSPLPVVLAVLHAFVGTVCCALVAYRGALCGLDTKESGSEQCVTWREMEIVVYITSTGVSDDEILYRCR